MFSDREKKKLIINMSKHLNESEHVGITALNPNINEQLKRYTNEWNSLRTILWFLYSLRLKLMILSRFGTMDSKYDGVTGI